MTDCTHRWDDLAPIYLTQASGFQLTAECKLCHSFIKRNLPCTTVVQELGSVPPDLWALTAYWPGAKWAPKKSTPPPPPRLESNAMNIYGAPVEGWKEFERGMQNSLATPKHKPSAACSCEACRARSAELDAAINVYRDQPLRPL